MLEVTQLNVAYGRAQVLFGVSLEVPDDGLACVMGRNGVGKTTLLNAIMGVLRTSSGRVRFDGRDLTRAKPYERVRAGLAYVPQGRGGFPQLSVRENLDVVMSISTFYEKGRADAPKPGGPEPAAADGKGGQP